MTAEEETDVYERLLSYAIVLGVEDIWLTTAEALGISDRAWVPESGLTRVIEAVTAAGLAERLDGRIDPMPGTSPRAPDAPVTGGTSRHLRRAAARPASDPRRTVRHLSGWSRREEGDQGVVELRCVAD
ncbi:MAG: hypothetical protein ABIS35_04365, partial [Terracoccus sp.]